MCTPVCRVCLAGDVAMHSIEQTHLLAIYETLTSTKFITEDGMPNTICYMCYWQLQRCRRFSEAARTSQGILSDLLRTGVQITSDTVKQNQRIKQAMPSSQNLSVASLQSWSLNDHSNIKSTLFTIKQEQIVADEETITENKWTVIEDNIQEVDVGVRRDLNDKEQSMESSSEIDDKAKLYSDVCSKSFTRKPNFEPHLGNNSELKPYACTKCNKTFTRKSIMSNHMKVHTGEKPYACSRCSKAFSKKDHLTRHMGVHTGEKPYACVRCDKTFLRCENMTRHMRIHTGDKPYACNRCEMVFAAKGNLTSHMRIHAGVKPYACKRCQMTFTEKGTLTKHNMRAHAEIHTT